jgi:hypothetical protein
MKLTALAIPCLLVVLTGCGRTDPGRIVNGTDETLLVALRLNYPFTEHCPDNYFREEIMQNYKAGPKESKTAADYAVSFDSISNIAVLKLLPDDVIDLGTVRLDADRNDYRSWEFTDISCKGNKGFTMHAQDESLMKYVGKSFLPIAVSYDFVIE